MADSEKTIRLKIELEIARAKSNIKGLESQIEKLDMRFTENKVKAKQLAVEYDKLASSKSRLSQSSSTLEQSSTNVSKKLSLRQRSRLRILRTNSGISLLLSVFFI